MAEREIYKVIVSNPAMYRFQDEVLGYIERNFSVSKAIEVEAALLQTVRTLAINPQRGSLENSVSGRSKTYRFILFRKTRYFELKILFFVEEDNRQVVITDFFPTRMNPAKMKFS